jgi:hypothetical protein
MASEMTGGHLWNILNRKAILHRTFTEIHVLEPDRMEALIQAFQALPHIPPDH